MSYLAFAWVSIGVCVWVYHMATLPHFARPGAFELCLFMLTGPLAVMTILKDKRQ